MAYENLKYERRDHVAVATLDRPDKLNALNGSLNAEILAVAKEVGRDDDVRALVITGSGRGFCSAGGR